MRSDKLEKSSWGIEQHPSTEVLRQYEEGILSAALSHEVERHLLDCELCDDILSGMALTDRSSTQKARSRILQHLKSRLRKPRKRTKALHILGDWRVAAAILMMFSSLGLLLFYQYTRSMAVQKTALYPGGIVPPTPEELLARTIDSALVLEIPAPPAPARHLNKSEQSEEALVIQGRVLSVDEQGLAAVQVQVAGTSLLTTTDEQGNFSIRIPVSSSTLLFRARGFQQQEITVTDTTKPLLLKMAINTDDFTDKFN